MNALFTLLELWLSESSMSYEKAFLKGRREIQCYQGEYTSIAWKDTKENQESTNGDYFVL